MTIRVLLVDDDPLLRMGVATVLSAHPDLELVGEAGGGRQAVAMAGELAPDIVVMDVRMPDVDGIEATRRIIAAGLDTSVLVLTTFSHDDHVAAALRAGASGFLLKRVPPERLVEAIRIVAGGEALLDPAVTRQVIAGFAATPTAPVTDSRLDQLTEREDEVFTLLSSGLSNAEIAEVLVVAESTVKTHVRHVLAKLEVRDRIAAVVLAYESGRVRPGGSPP